MLQGDIWLTDKGNNVIAWLSMRMKCKKRKKGEKVRCSDLLLKLDESEQDLYGFKLEHAEQNEWAEEEKRMYIVSYETSTKWGTEWNRISNNSRYWANPSGKLQQKVLLIFSAALPL